MTKILKSNQSNLREKDFILGDSARVKPTPVRNSLEPELEEAGHTPPTVRKQRPINTGLWLFNSFSEPGVPARE